MIIPSLFGPTALGWAVTMMALLAFVGFLLTVGVLLYPPIWIVSFVLTLLEGVL